MCDTAAVHLGVEPLIPFGSGDGSRRERFGVKGKRYVRDAVVVDVLIFYRFLQSRPLFL